MSAIIFRQLADPVSSTYTYLLADPDSREAVLIDTVFEHTRRDMALVRELGLTLKAVLETHVHADHISGGWMLKRATGCRTVISAQAGVRNADVLLQDGDRVSFGQRYLEARSTPGHTDGCMTFVLDDHRMAFTGDCLLIRGCGRTDFQQGSAERLYRSVHERILSLPDDCLLYPGHDYRGLTVTSVAEEREFNPRLGGQSNEVDFAGYMNNLGLPHPKLMDIAVPANLSFGKPESDAAGLEGPRWAPLTCSFGGIWEIQPADLDDCIDRVQVVDVREDSEFAQGMGRIGGSLHIPLSQLARSADKLSKDRPIVTVCRSGARSAQATVLLKKAGFEDTANLAGGLLRWISTGYPVERQAP